MSTQSFWGVFREVFELQNGWVDIWFMRFHFRASIKPIFENHVLRAVSGPLRPLYETKISNRSLSVVYGSITLKFFQGLWELVRTSGSIPETKFKKRVFLGHPTQECLWNSVDVVRRTLCENESELILRDWIFIRWFSLTTLTLQPNL